MTTQLQLDFNNSAPKSEPFEDPTNVLFERLRNLAEDDTAGKGTDRRRPSWGPALAINNEFRELLTFFKHDPHLDKPVLRLWAIFADPKRVGRFLRETQSAHPMPEARVRAFELQVGTKRSGFRLLLAKRGFSGWDVNAVRHFAPDHYELIKAQRDLRSKKRDLEYKELYGAAEIELQTQRAAIAEAEKLCAELKADSAEFASRAERFQELIKQRLAEFAGDPFTQMVAGAHVTGHCCICGRELTNPLSIERGIGPECYDRISPALLRYVEQRGAV